jgi:hypothetical protein
MGGAAIGVVTAKFLPDMVPALAGAAIVLGARLDYMVRKLEDGMRDVVQRVRWLETGGGPR